MGLASRVDLKLRDIQDGFDETDADAFFLDVPNPWDYVHKVRSALKPGGFFGCLVPTFNQVEDLLIAMRQGKFAFVEVCEILLRYFKPEPARIRPTDRMVAHTGFLIFGRRIEPVNDERGIELAREIGAPTARARNLVELIRDRIRILGTAIVGIDPQGVVACADVLSRGGARPLRRMGRGGIPPLLIRSNELLATGQFAKGADGLEKLARAAEGRGGRRAANLYIEAGRARVMAGQNSEGVELLERGIGLLAASPFHGRLARAGRRIINELKERGLAEEAEQIAVLLGGVNPEPEPSAAGTAALRRPPLPTRCPGCGAPVRPDEVDWLDDVTAECEYCGSPVRAD